MPSRTARSGTPQDPWAGIQSARERMKAEKNAWPSSRSERSRNSSLVWAWAMEPGPMQMEGRPVAERWAASENQGAPTSWVRGWVARSFWMKGSSGFVSIGGFSWADSMVSGR